MNNSNFKEKFAPTIVLLAICLVMTIALVFTNEATAPQIAKIAKENADATRAIVLEDADAFTAYDGKLNENVTELYFANNKAGAVVTTTSKSFGGTMTVMTGIDANGAITGVQVTGHADTPGLGTKAMTPEYLSGCYLGDTTLAAANVKDEAKAGTVDYIVGASVSSQGVYDAVKTALQQFNDCGGVK